MSTIRVVVDTSLPPERVLEAAHDFSERREKVFPAVSIKHMDVHRLEDASADVTEGTRAGPIFNWERCEYDWSHPDLVTANVRDSNVYRVPGSSWELRTTPKESGGTKVEMLWIREFRGSLKGRFFGALFRLAGNRIFNHYGREILENLEHLEGER